MMADIYVRISLAQPHMGNEAALAKIDDDLMEFFAQQPGYIHGYRIVGGDVEGRVGRLTIWNSEEDASNAAQTDHVLALRSQLLLLIDEDSHVEDSWTARDVPKK
jgi:hypothetical protein